MSAPVTTTGVSTLTVLTTLSGPSTTVSPIAVQILSSITFNYSAALTTPFTPGSECTNGAWVSSTSTQGVITCSLSVATTSLCYPLAFETLQASAGIYSPGACPQSYSAARSWTVNTSDATTSICCPFGMEYLQPFSACASFVTTPATVVISDQSSNYTYPFTAFAPTIAVAWASSDLPDFTPASAPLLLHTAASSSGTLSTLSMSTSTNGTAILSSSTTAALPSTTNPPSTADGLSSGAKAGIGVGVAIAAVLGLVAGAWLVLRRRRQTPTEQNDGQALHSKAELPGKDAEKKFSELDLDTQRSEMTGVGRLAEMGQEERHELDGGWQAHEAPAVAEPIATPPDNVRRDLS